jgi:hypothetical protein
MILYFIWSSIFGILLLLNLNLKNVDLLIITITTNLSLISSYQNINKFIVCKIWCTFYTQSRIFLLVNKTQKEASIMCLSIYQRMP